MEEKEFRRVASYILIFCFMLSSLLIAGERNVAASYTRYVKAQSLSIRKSASNSASVLGYYVYGTKVTCYATTGGWTKVKYNGKYAYISTSYLATSKPKTVQISSATTSKTAKSSSSYTRYVTASSLTIRKKASASSASAGVYRKGDKVTCYGTSGSWTKVKVNGATCYVSTKYLSTSKVSSTSSNTSSTSSSSAYTRYITASTLNIRKKASASSQLLKTLSYGSKVTCYGTSGSWTKVVSGSTTGYMCTKYLSSSKPSASSKPTSSVSGTTVANAAKKYAGKLRYVWGGESLTKGVDCSGFTKAIYAQYGYSLPHSAYSQRSSGKAVSSSNRKAGDLICYTSLNGSYHVGIYIGNNQVVHASSPSTGVRISTWNYRKVYCVRRIIN